MTDRNTDKIYHRQFSAEANESLALVGKHIAPNSRVLDVGCGAGDLGEYLRSEKGCYVVGADYSSESLAVAKTKLDDVCQIDLNCEKLDAAFAERFDVIVMADILEHIYDTESVLSAAEALLTPNGKVIISIPNAGYVGALLSLYDDSWRYREEGILDRTHIRFYTKQSVFELLAHSGFDGVICDRVCRDLLDSEFTQRIDSQADAVRDWLLAKPEGATYQFIVEARPKSQKYRFAAEAAPIPMSLQHIVKCYWQEDGVAAYSDGACAIARGTMGKSNALSFATGAEKIQNIRLDFADRRSIYRIDNVEIYDGEQRIWSATSDACSLTAYNVAQPVSSLPATMIAIDDQAFLELCLAEPIQGQQLSIAVTLLAPIGENNMTFADTIALPQYQQAVDEQRRLASLLAKTSAESGAFIARLEETIHSERSQVKQLSEEQAKLEKEIARLHALHQQHIEAIYQSSSWKITAPLRKIIRLFK